jgi:hypothetical protein
LIYAILGSIGVGILITLFIGIPRAIKSSLRSKELKEKIENLETMLHSPAGLRQEGNKSKI